MTKNILILSLFILSAIKINAQCTPDNTITKAGFYPSKLPDAILNTAYSEVLHFKILKDTMVVVFGSPQKATVDSAIIVKVNGMPANLAFQLNKSNKTYTPEEVGCALLSGTPINSGTFPLQIVINLFAKVSGFPVSQIDTIKSFSLVVKKDAAISKVIQNQRLFYPNPLSGNQLNINSEIVIPGSIFKIFNCQGQLLRTQTIESSSETLTFNYPQGIYYLQVKSGDSVFNTRLLKE